MAATVYYLDTTKCYRGTRPSVPRVLPVRTPRTPRPTTLETVLREPRGEAAQDAVGRDLMLEQQELFGEE
jgi:hypothetical protein